MTSKRFLFMLKSSFDLGKENEKAWKTNILKN